MDRTAMTQSPPLNGHQTLYFAYGSNLHLSQMAERCPESHYVGRGRLKGFRWQINSRGYANIFRSTDDVVEGLCFLLSQEDERRLDINEGVQGGAYDKHWLVVEVFSADTSIAGRSVQEVNQHIRETGFSSLQPTAITSEEIQCLTYANFAITDDGRPQDEYFGRINLGVADAQKLGISSQYFDEYFTGPMEWSEAQDALGMQGERRTSSFQ